MGTGILTVNRDALAQNWRSLARMNKGETGAVVKADGYGLGAGLVAECLAEAGARSFFVATAEEGAQLRPALGDGPEIYIFSGHMEGDTSLLRDHALIPLLNSPEQVARHKTALPGHGFGLQLDSGMNRLGLEPEDFSADMACGAALVMSHLACADEPDHAANAAQLASFRDMTDALDCPRSLAATGGTLLGPEFHFDMTRPGVGLYGGLPFEGALPVVTLDLPVIQTRVLQPGESAGYGCAFVAKRETRIATISSGYADGLIRAMSGKAMLYAGDTPCPLAGRVSMDLLTVDVTGLDTVPDSLQILGPHQSVDQLAEAAGTIGYEILTLLGPRYQRRVL